MKTNFNFEERLLSDLQPGAEAVVETVDGASPQGRRLMELGLLPQTPIRMIRSAPLGDPIVYELRGYRLCLRRSEARCVRIRTEEAVCTHPGGNGAT